MRTLSLFVLLSFLAIPSFAQNSTGIAKYAGEFMATGFGSRALAMGGTHAAVANDVSSAFWNPAGLMNMNYPEIGLMHEQRFGGLATYNYGGIAWPFSTKYTVALSVTRLGVDDIPDTRNADWNNNNILEEGERLDYSRIKMFSAADWMAYLTYAFRGTEDLSLGVNLKLIRRTMGDFGSATGIGFDAGMQYRVTPEFMLGGAVRDITTTLIAWNTGTNDLVSPTFLLGGAYTLDVPGGVLTPAVDFEIMAENRRTSSLVHLGPISFVPRAGFEYQFRDLFAIRAGFNETKRLSFGAGVHLPKLYLDYAFGQNPFSDGIGDGFSDQTSHRISIRLMLEEPKFLRPSN